MFPDEGGQAGGRFIHSMKRPSQPSSCAEFLADRFSEGHVPESEDWSFTDREPGPQLAVSTIAIIPAR